jgi:hypothetical protein
MYIGAKVLCAPQQHGSAAAPSGPLAETVARLPFTPTSAYIVLAFVAVVLCIPVCFCLSLVLCLSACSSRFRKLGLLSTLRCDSSLSKCV